MLRHSKPDRSFFRWLLDAIQSLLWRIKSAYLDLQLKDEASPLRSDAEEALSKVVYMTNIDPSCVSVGIVRGGPAVSIKHNAATEIFIGKTYDHAADESIAWLRAQGDELETNKKSTITRREHRAFNSMRRRGRRLDKSEEN